MKRLFIVNYNKYFSTQKAELEFRINGIHESHRILFYLDKYNRPTVYLAHQHPKFSGRSVPYDYYDEVFGIWNMSPTEANNLYNHLVKSINIDSFYDIHTRRRVYVFSPNIEVLYEAIYSYTGSEGF